MEQRRSRFDRMREENEKLLPLIRKARAAENSATGLPLKGGKAASTGIKVLSDQAAEAIANTLKIYLEQDKKNG